MQSLETGGIQHSGDEQGRAPLESQSSICQNVANSANKNHEGPGGGQATVEDTNHGMTTNINTGIGGPSQAQLI